MPRAQTYAALELDVALELELARVLDGLADACDGHVQLEVVDRGQVEDDADVALAGPEHSLDCLRDLTEARGLDAALDDASDLDVCVDLERCGDYGRRDLLGRVDDLLDTRHTFA